ncbi:MAG: diaminopimelate epimerase [Paludibacter sp.]|nr:diaminopimelate epimerase [Bacteroidales bacterium]MCM1068383.1 diaminopimelate epimerase [Prevotella sp.]MCM1354532.1 diaminopimelate epimerase [Bacteroides sp.]MCM1443449.1 diaminopimelate epimerase [Muribaculum sp.]MCM1482650.1 diaminopimelate epimerase [Paludibacter sp.]
MTLPFTKMQGAGNDYIYINAFVHSISNPSEMAVRLSDRHFGIGSDGLVLLMPSTTCDLRMRMFNADGSEAQMCGNAARCVGKYAYEKGLVAHSTDITLETLAGQKHLQLHLDKHDKVEAVTVNMGAPQLTPEALPVRLTTEQMLRYPINIDGFQGMMTCVGMGNPHAVFFVDNLDSTDIHRIGKLIEHHPLFPEQTNVEFAQVVSKTDIRMRVWERGSGETMACGTGACATLVAAAQNQYTQTDANIHCLGGTLHIRWDKVSNNVFLTGQAQYTFEGIVDYEYQ